MVALANGVTIAAATNGRENTASHFGPLFQGMAAELKASNSAWEHCCSRATKLAANLQATASALAHFVEALQTVSDSANNVNGQSAHNVVVDKREEGNYEKNYGEYYEN
jgi:hypothetical protein